MKSEEKRIDVLLHIYSLTTNNNEKQEHKQQIEARVYQKANALYIRYAEKVEDVEPVSTVVKVEDEQVTIIRQGAIKMNHVYRLGETTTSIYYTPHGSLEMEVQTTKLNFRPMIDSNQGQLSLEYALSLQHEFVGHFTLEIRMNMLH